MSTGSLPVFLLKYHNISIIIRGLLVPVEFRRRSVGLFVGNVRVLWKNGRLDRNAVYVSLGGSSGPEKNVRSLLHQNELQTWVTPSHDFRQNGQKLINNTKTEKILYCI